MRPAAQRPVVMPRKDWWSRLSASARRRSRNAAKRFDAVLLEVHGKDLRTMRKCLVALEAELSAQSPGTRERLEWRRRAAEHYLNACLSRRASWTTTLGALSRLEALGYTNIDRRVHFAIMLGRYAPRGKRASQLVQSRVRLAIRRTKALPSRSPFRRAYLPIMERLVASAVQTSDSRNTGLGTRPA